MLKLILPRFYRHPHALGSPGTVVWQEIWGILQPMLQEVVQMNQASWSENQVIFLTRNYYLEETYFTRSLC